MSDEYVIAVERGPKSKELAPASKGLVRLIATAILCGAGSFLLGLLAAILLHQFLPSPPTHMAAANRILSSHIWFLPSLVALIVAPLYETIIGQLIPIELLRRCNAPHIVLLVASGAVFAGGHYFSNGPIHALRSLISGILLAELYCRYRKDSVASSYLAVVIAHAFNNLCVLTIMAFGIRD